MKHCTFSVTPVLSARSSPRLHRGSNLAESWIGDIGQSLIHLPSALQTSIVTVISENQDVATPGGESFR